MNGKERDMEEITTKVCRCCGKKLPITEFWNNRSYKDGHESICKECKNKKQRAYRDKINGKSKTRKKSAISQASHPDILPFVEETQPQALNLADMTDKELFVELRRRGYTGDLRLSKVISI